MALALQSFTFIQQYAASWMHSKTRSAGMALHMGVISAANIDAAGSEYRLLSYTSTTRVDTHEDYNQY